MRRTYYIDEKTKKLVEGYPPKKYRTYGTGPIFISDSMPAQYHEGAKMVIESRSAWRHADKMTGSLTLSRNEFNAPGMQPPDHTAEEKRQRREDIRQARMRAVAAVKNGTAPLTDDQKQICKNNDEIISHQLGYDVNKLWKPKKARAKRKKAA